MILTIDIGNSTVNIGIFEKQQLIEIFSFPSTPNLTVSQTKLFFEELSKQIKEKKEIEGGIISSVVPKLTETIKKSLKEIGANRILILESGIKTGLQIKTDNPSEVGGDLIAAACGLFSKYSLPAIIVDLGTATTISFIDQSKSFLGVAIAPGIKTGLQALISNAALLHDIRLEVSRNILGRNTADAMKSGSIIGHAIMIDGFIDKIIETYSCQPSIVITGGLAEVVLPHLTHKVAHDPHLLHEGLYRIYLRNIDEAR